MPKKTQWLHVVLTGSLLATLLSAHPQATNDFARKRLDTIASGLNRLLFVNRFESVESPCLFIDSADNTVATPARAVINSNYRSRLAKGSIDENGVKCLSDHYAKYLQFKTERIAADSLVIEGEIRVTYGYPAPSIMQYLCFTAPLAAKNTAYFEKMTKTKGWFRLYPEKDKYVIATVIRDQPFDPRDTVYGYLEITKGYFDSLAPASFQFIFERISLYKGDKNNQLSMRYTSTDHRSEMMYYTSMVHEVLKNIHSGDIQKKAYAKWLSNYLLNRNCIRCDLIYKPASMVNNGFILPDTEPQPAH